MPVEGIKTDAQWQAEGDAHTLASANEILNDDKRWNAAQKAAKKMAEHQMKHVEGLLKVAGKTTKVEGMKVLGSSN